MQPTAYPFPYVKIGDNTTTALIKLLPGKQEIFESLKTFREISRSFVVPQPPDKTREKEVQQFLSNIEHNAIKAPDMLALLFASLALVCHTGVAGRMSRHTSNEVQALFARGNCYSKWSTV